MKQLRWLLFAWAVALMAMFLCAMLHAQNVTVTGSHTQNSAGQLITGNVYFQPTNSAGQPVSYRNGSGGAVTSVQVSTPIVRGAFTITLPDVTATNPANICFAFSAADSSGNNQIPNGYSCLQPHTTAIGSGDWCQAGVCNLDNYIPQTPNGTTLGVTTIGGVSGNFTFSGSGVNCSGTNCSFSTGGATAFSSITPGTNTLGGFTIGNGSTLMIAPYINSTPGATPALVATNGFQEFVLNANAAPTISGIAPGQHITFEICQPGSGGPYTWTWPASFHGGMAIGTIAGYCSRQSFDSSNGTDFLSDGPGVINVQP